MPNLRHQHDHGRSAGKGKNLEGGKPATQEDAKQAALGLRQQSDQSNASATRQLQASREKLNRYAGSGGAFKKATEQERKELSAALEKFAGRQEEHLAERQKATDRIAEAARNAVENLPPDAGQSRWADARKILQDTRKAVDELRASDDARLRESREKVNDAAGKSPTELSARLDEDATQAPSLQDELRRDANKVLERLSSAFESLRTSRTTPEKRADSEEHRVTPIQAAKNALEAAATRADVEIKTARDEMAIRHEREGKTIERLRPGDADTRRALVDSQKAQRERLENDVRNLQQELKELRRSANVKGADVEAIADKARGLELAKTQVVRDSNLFYDFDHYRPQSREKEHGVAPNRADNLGFLMADENRRKGATEFKEPPTFQPQIKLKDALAAGKDATRKAVSEMLGSRRFSEIAELNSLWQQASANETRSYQASQAEFRKLIGGDYSSELRANAEKFREVREAAETLRKALAAAKIDIVEHGESFRLRLDDSEYRR